MHHICIFARWNVYNKKAGDVQEGGGGERGNEMDNSALLPANLPCSWHDKSVKSYTDI